MSSNQPVKKPIEILFSYAREDEKLRDELEKGLSVLKRQNRIVCWHDRQISGGDPWEQAISSHLDTVDIILLLVSRAFIASSQALPLLSLSSCQPLLHVAATRRRRRPPQRRDQTPIQSETGQSND